MCEALLDTLDQVFRQTAPPEKGLVYLHVPSESS